MASQMRPAHQMGVGMAAGGGVTGMQSEQGGGWAGNEVHGAAGSMRPGSAAMSWSRPMGGGIGEGQPASQPLPTPPGSAGFGLGKLGREAGTVDPNFPNWHSSGGSVSAGMMSAAMVGGAGGIGMGMRGGGGRGGGQGMGGGRLGGGGAGGDQVIGGEHAGPSRGFHHHYQGFGGCLLEGGSAGMMPDRNFQANAGGGWGGGGRGGLPLQPVLQGPSLPGAAGRQQEEASGAHIGVCVRVSIYH